MIVYIALLAFLLALALIPQKYDKVKRWGFVASVAVMILIAGLRSWVGTDYGSYIDHYHSLVVRVEPWAEFELFYEMFSRLISLFRLPPYVFFTAVAAITVLPVAVTIRRESDNPELSLFLYVALYFYFTAFNQVRQYVAVSLVFVAYPWLRDRRILPYMLTVLAAGMFHAAAFVMIPFYFVAGLRVPLWLQGIVMVFGAAMSVFGEELIRTVVELVPKYAHYGDMGGSSAWLDLGVLVVTLVLLNLTKCAPEDTRTKNIFRNAALIAALLSWLTSCNLLFARVHAFFHIFTIVSLPFCAARAPEKYKKLVMLGICLMAIMLSLHHFRGNISEIIPYRAVSFS